MSSADRAARATDNGQQRRPSPVLNSPASGSAGLLPVGSRTQRRRIRAGHVHRFHRLRLSSGGTVLIASVAQGHVVPSTWATAYASLPSQPEPLVRDVRFEPIQLQEYQTAYSRRSLDWLDSRFMLRLALEQCLADLQEHFGAGGASGGGGLLSGEPERITSTDLHVLRVQGALPHLQQLMERCREHLMLFQELRQVHDLPSPTLVRR